MASVLLSFSGFLNIEKNYSDSVVLVLQYRITFACIMTFVLISGTYTVFRDPISTAQVNLKVIDIDRYHIKILILLAFSIASIALLPSYLLVVLLLQLFTPIPASSLY